MSVSIIEFIRSNISIFFAPVNWGQRSRELGVATSDGSGHMPPVPALCRRWKAAVVVPAPSV